MHIHSAYFWLRDPESDADRQVFEEGLALLATDPNISVARWGRPADTTHRDVVEGSYHYGTSFMFDDLGSHNRYQTSPVHARFVAECGPLWARVDVTDLETG